MNTKTWLGVAAAVVIVGLGAWYFMGTAPAGTPVTGEQNATSTSPTGATPSGSVSGAGTISDSGTIGSLLALGKNLQCSVTLSTEGAQTEGVIYLSSGGKMRGDFSTAAKNGNVITSTTINNGTYVYSWTNLSTQGYKTTVAAAGSTGMAAHGGVDTSTAINYSCKAWSPDQSKFVPPSKIKF